jgi:hypothetical protein
MSRMIPVRMSDELVARIDARTENRSALIVGAVEQYLSGSQEEKKPAKMIIEKPRAKPIETPKVAREIPKAETKPAKLAPCPRCEGPTIPWGPMRRCANCNQNWPM